MIEWQMAVNDVFRWQPYDVVAGIHGEQLPRRVNKASNEVLHAPNRSSCSDGSGYKYVLNVYETWVLGNRLESTREMCYYLIKHNLSSEDFLFQ